MDHPNRLAFEGVLTLVGVASEKAPSGARGHRVILAQGGAEDALPSLIGMAVDYKCGWGGHDPRQKVGVIDAAEIVGRELRISGYIFARDFPEIAIDLDHERTPPMGMSYELADAHVVNMRADVWTVNLMTFTGAAILLREHAAYKRTSFHILEAARESECEAMAARGMELKAVCEVGL